MRILRPTHVGIIPNRRFFQSDILTVPWTSVGSFGWGGGKGASRLRANVADKRCRVVWIEKEEKKKKKGKEESANRRNI
jgi:hypothetical protein